MLKNTVYSIFVLLACAMSPIDRPLFSEESAESKVVRVFIFAGQSNMVGSDSKVKDIQNFPPYVGLDQPQRGVAFSYCIGREDKFKSDGWVDLQPVDGVVGPELSFARLVRRHSEAPIAIIKCAAGGTHLGGDWNPDQPSGFKMYPLTLDWIRSSLALLEKQGTRYRIEGFMWHQGENDMFEDEYRTNYGPHLKNFLARWRRDLKTPDLKFYIGELCTKTIWGMDLRPRMDEIRRGQQEVTESDPLAEYIPTAHVGVEIGGGVGLHYHYGTLGQLEHGQNYARAYLKSMGIEIDPLRPLKSWPFKKRSRVQLFILAGHRNMEGERAFVDDLKKMKGGATLLRDQKQIPFLYSLGGGYRVSHGWEPLGPTGFYETFGPELSFGATLKKKLDGNFAIAKFTHSGSQMIDWTPEGSGTPARNLYQKFIASIVDSVRDLQEKGHRVDLAGIFYHVGENDMSFGPYRERAAERLASIIRQSRKDLGLPSLHWYVSQQAPTDDQSVNGIDVSKMLEEYASTDEHTTLIQVFDLPGQEKKLVISTAGIVELGVRMAQSHLRETSPTRRN